MDQYNNVSYNALNLYSSRLNNEYRQKGIELSERDQAALFAQCVETQVLKSPASAVFPPLNQMVVSGQDGKYAVSGFVDSQNSYGAMIRTNYSFNIEKFGDAWKCADHFVDNSTVIQKNMMSNTVLWWVLGIIGTIITYFIIHYTTMAEMDSLFSFLLK